MKMKRAATTIPASVTIQLSWDVVCAGGEADSKSWRCSPAPTEEAPKHDVKVGCEEDQSISRYQVEGEYFPM
jgi:hypothetical protein